MTVKFLDSAQLEFHDSVNYYNEQSFGWGFEFALEIQKTINRIVLYPNAWVQISKRARKCKCNRFPYSVIYFFDNDEIIIVALMHSKRNPGYWFNRIN
jgi:hypothetical protein